MLMRRNIPIDKNMLHHKKLSLTLTLTLLLFSSLATTVQAREVPREMKKQKTVDKREYFVGTFSIGGFDTAVIESYKSEATITINEGHFLNISIDHSKESGVGTYYGHLSEIDEDTLQLDYWNLGRQKHTAICDYQNDTNNFPHFTCKGSLLGNVGGDGVFVIHKEWD